MDLAAIWDFHSVSVWYKHDDLVQPIGAIKFWIDRSYPKVMFELPQTSSRVKNGDNGLG